MAKATTTELWKKVKINGLEQKKISSYIGSLNVIMFSPEDLEIIKLFIFIYFYAFCISMHFFISRAFLLY